MSFQRATISLQSVAPDLIPQDAPPDVWNYANNVVFKNGESSRVAGDAPTLPGATVGAGNPPRTIVFLGVVNSGYWVYATATGIFAHDGTTETEITPAAGWTISAGSTVTSCVMNGLVFINSSDRDPVFWTGDTADLCAPLPDWPIDGRTTALRSHKGFLFAIGFISEGKQRVRWSDVAEVGEVPQSWTPAADNLAGFVDLAPLSSGCLEGHALRDSFLVYKGEGIWSFDFVGGNAVFAVRSLFHEHGIVNTNALTAGIDDVHLFVGSEGDIFITDGVSVKSVLDGRAQRTFAQDFTTNNASVFAALTLAREKQGAILFPTGGALSCDRALVYDFVSGSIAFRDMPMVYCAAEGRSLQATTDLNDWDGDDEGWDTDQFSWSYGVPASSLDDALIGGEFGFAIVSNRGTNDFITGPVEAVIGKAGLSFGNPQTRKTLARVWPKVTGETGQILNFRMGGQEITGGPVALGPILPFVIGSNAPLDTFVQGRFVSMEISSRGGGAWSIGTIDVEIREAGKW